jgi:methyl-accepting chemotaxis protein
MRKISISAIILSSILCLAGTAILVFIDKPLAFSGALLTLVGAGIAPLRAAGIRREAARGMAALRAESSAAAAKAGTAEPAARKAEGLAAASAGEAEKLRASLRSIYEARMLVPFLRSIIAAVPAKTEEAAFRLMEKFELVKRLTDEAAAEAKELDSDTAEGSLEERVKAMSETSRSSLRKEREAVTEIVSLNRSNAKELKDMGVEIASGLELLKGIEDISEKSHLIALNLSVEAAHIGSQGLGFKVIATELRSLNAQTGEFSKKVSELLDSLRRRSAAIIGQMAEKSESVVAEAEKGMGLAAQAVESLIAASAASHAYTARIADKARSIHQAMDGVLESLQFQDITRQMLEGAGQIAEEIEPLMRAAQAGMPGGDGAAGDAAATAEALRERLLGRAKTKGEKEAIMEVKP